VNIVKSITKNQIKILLDELIEIHIAHLSEILLLITKTYEMIDQNKEDREKIQKELRKRLSKETSLRGVDFDLIIQKIQKWRLIQEMKIKAGIYQFSITQVDFAKKFKEILQIKNFKAFSSLKYQVEQKIKETIQMITKFHQEQIMFTNKLKLLLNEKTPLTMVEFKKVMKQI